MTMITLSQRATGTAVRFSSVWHAGVALDMPGNYLGSALQPDASVVTPQRIDLLREQFRALADWWHDATDALSSSDAKADHPAYQRIIGLGPAVLRYTLEDLRGRGGHWFAALEKMTGIQPQLLAGTTPSVRSERNAWLAWGREQGLLD